MFVPCQLTHSSNVLAVFLSRFLVNFFFFCDLSVSHNNFSLSTKSFSFSFKTIFSCPFHNFLQHIPNNHISQKSLFTVIQQKSPFLTFHQKTSSFSFHSHKQNNPFQTKILIHCDIESVLLVFVLFQEWIPHHVVHTPDIVVDHE